MSLLPDLPAGVYQHYKGPLYLVFGYAHDANADVYGKDAVLAPKPVALGERLAVIYPLGERTVVVYVGLQLDEAHTGPRLAIRDADDFHKVVCIEPECSRGRYGKTPYDPAPDAEGVGGGCRRARRFTYIGPEWKGDS